MTINELKLSSGLLQNIEKMGFTHATEIQQQAIPFILEQNRDLIALAQTGTGKTAAFGLPIIDKIEGNSKQPKAIILCPTRELAIQIAKEMNMYAANTKKISIQVVYGGANISNQISNLRRGCDIVVGTPGRTLDLLKRKSLNISEVEYFVLDEADEMLNMGFKEDLDDIISYIPQQKQTLLFSATFPREVAQLAKNYLINPHQITIGTQNSASKQITHQYCVVRSTDKVEALKRIIDSNPGLYAIAFCKTRLDTQNVAGKLIDAGYSADAIHGDLSQAQRENIIRKFKKKSIKVLIATDVVARGLDITNLTHVLNLNLPDDPEVYIHRSGRTGRAGKTGVSICIIHSREHRKFKDIATSNKINFEKILIPSGLEICQDLLMQHIAKVQETTISDEVRFFLPEIEKYFEGISKEEIIGKFVSLEFNQILHKYKNTSNLNVEVGKDSYKNDRGRDRGRDRNNRDRGGRERFKSDRTPNYERRNNDRKERSLSNRKSKENFNPGNFIRYHINIGKNQNFKRGSLFEVINKSEARGAEIGDIEVHNNFTYFEVDKKFERQINEAFKNKKIEGIDTIIEKAKPKV